MVNETVRMGLTIKRSNEWSYSLEMMQPLKNRINKLQFMLGQIDTVRRRGQNMLSREDVLEYGLTFSNVYVDTPFHDPNWVLLRYEKNKRAFAWTYEREGHIWVNVKVDPEWRDFWRNTYSSVIPAYHQNKEHWNSIILDGTIPDTDIKRMIAESYDLICKKK